MSAVAIRSGGAVIGILLAAGLIIAQEIERRSITCPHNSETITAETTNSCQL